MYSAKAKHEGREVLEEREDKYGIMTRLVAVQSIMDEKKLKWFTVWAVEREYSVGRFQYWVYPDKEQAERSFESWF